MTNSTEIRKEDHIKLCIDKNVRSDKNFWDDMTLIGENIPDVSMEDIDISSVVAGKQLKAPLIIAAMTGGCNLAQDINKRLASAAQKFGIGLGVGSQRAAIENPALVNTYSVVKDFDIPLVIGNIGVPQVILSPDIHKLFNDLVQMIKADCIAIHLNFSQEITQPEGDLIAKGFWEKIFPYSKEFFLIIKETGSGLSKNTAKKAADHGFRFADIGGLSGTSFPAVEYYRAVEKNDIQKQNLAKLLWNWGIPSPVSIFETKPYLPIIATGGIRNGLDMAKALALGADAAGIALELLAPAYSGMEQLEQKIESIIQELKSIMFLTNCKTIRDLRKRRWFTTDDLYNWLNGLNYNVRQN